jgi:hypothetical protein
MMSHTNDWYVNRQETKTKASSINTRKVGHYQSSTKAFTSQATQAPCTRNGNSKKDCTNPNKTTKTMALTKP